MAAGALVLIAGPAAFGEKRVTVKLERSPELAVALAGKAVGAVTSSGECGEELAGLVKQDLVSRGIRMAMPGEAAGPVVSFALEITRCEAQPREPLRGAGLPAMNISRTEGHVAATVRLVDAGGKELAKAAIHGDAQKENQSQTGQPEYPAPAEVKDMALRRAVGDARRLYLPWMESREIPLMDNKECNLRAAYDAVKRGDNTAALGLARAGVEECAGSAKAGGEARYNLGVALMLARDYAGALTALEGSGRGKEAKELVEICRSEAAARAALAPKPAEPPAGGTAQTGIILTNDFIIKLVKGDVAEEEILKMIAGHGGRYSFGPAEMRELEAAGVPASVIGAMRRKK